MKLKFRAWHKTMKVDESTPEAERYYGIDEKYLMPVERVNINLVTCNNALRSLLEKVGIYNVEVAEDGKITFQANAQRLIELGLREGHVTITGVVSPEDEEKEKKDLHNRNDV